MEKGKMGRGLVISFVLCSALAAAVSLWQMSFQTRDTAGTLLSWSNGCLAAGALWGGIGLLTLVAAFDGFSAVQYLSYVVRCKWTRREEGAVPESYFDFVNRKKAKREKKGAQLILLVPAAVYLLASAALTAAFCAL